MTEYFSHRPATPPAEAPVADLAVLTSRYAVIPPASMAPEVVSLFPGWAGTIGWVLAAPAIGHGTDFTEILMEIAPGGGSDLPDPEPGVESFLFVLRGRLLLKASGQEHTLRPGSFAYLPKSARWGIEAKGSADEPARMIWIRKRFQDAAGLSPELRVGHESDVDREEGPGAGRSTTRLLPADDPAYDFHVNFVRFEPGAVISTPEAHVMQHGLYMLSGQGLYMLDREWYEVGAGHFIWMKAFCPQAFVATGSKPTSYLLYKDMNRLPELNREGEGAR